MNADLSKGSPVSDVVFFQNAMADRLISAVSCFSAGARNAGELQRASFRLMTGTASQF